MRFIVDSHEYFTTFDVLGFGLICSLAQLGEDCLGIRDARLRLLHIGFWDII